MANFIKKIQISVALILCLGVSIGCSSKNKDIVPDKKPSELYTLAQDSLSKENFSKAREYLEAIDSRYPFGPYAHQVQLDLIYSYYKERENDLALAEIDRFITLNPSDENLDYVIYLRGLTNMQKGTDRFLDILHIDKYDRDSTYFEQAFFDFQKLHNLFPKSLYLADARERMIHIKNLLAKHELAIADYYYRKEAYISSIRRCQKIIEFYKDTEQFEDALVIMKNSFEKLGLKEESKEIQAFINLNKS